MPIQAVIFDMDGVLIDSEPHYNAADERLLNSLGIKFGEREAAAITGSSYRGIPAILRSWNPDITHGDDEIIRMYIDSLTNALVENVNELIPGAAEWIEYFRSKGLKTAIGSSSESNMVYHVINKFNLKPDAVVTGSDVEKGKPAPDIFLECAKRLGVPPENCLVIEDSQNGVNAAANAGMVCAAFLGTRCHNFDLSAADISIDAYDGENLAKIEELP